jgi:hypothetical protein
MAEPKNQVTIRIDPELHEAAREYAWDDGLTFTQFVVDCLTDAIGYVPRKRKRRVNPHSKAARKRAEDEQRPYKD